ncbi:Zinc finger BED domain-containing protein RICESLEEPER 2 [Linum perenne]
MLRSELYDLFELYKAEYDKRVNNTHSGSVASSTQTTGVSGDGGDEDDFEEDQEIEYNCFAEFDDDNHSDDDPRTELAKYLSEAREVSTDKKKRFDVLAYWEVSTLRFSILSEMVRDVLAVPISFVASESAFSTRGRVLSNFRISLTPDIVEALICAEDWLWSTSPDIFDPEEEENENEQLEFEKGKL